MKLYMVNKLTAEQVKQLMNAEYNRNGASTLFKRLLDRYQAKLR